MKLEQLEKAQKLKYEMEKIEYTINNLSMIDMDGQNTHIQINLPRTNTLNYRIPTWYIPIFKSTLIKHYEDQLDLLQQEFESI
jgi:hypothetical protein